MRMFMLGFNVIAMLYYGCHVYKYLVAADDVTHVAEKNDAGK